MAAFKFEMRMRGLLLCFTRMRGLNAFRTASEKKTKILALWPFYAYIYAYFLNAFPPTKFVFMHAVFGKLSPKTVKTYLDSFISVHHYLFCSLTSEQTISADVHYHFSSTLPKLDKNSTKTLHNF